MAEEELVRAEGGDSAQLYEHLRSTPYDLTVFVGFHSPVTCWGIRALPEGRRTMLVPGTRDEATLWLRLHDLVFDRAERILVCTESERAWIVPRLGPGREARVQDLGFVVGVNRMAGLAESSRSHGVVIASDWHLTEGIGWLVRLAQRLEGSHPDLRLRLVGPGADDLPGGVPFTASRPDAWRWMSRALALFDPTPHRVLGREVLEAMLFGVPVVVNAFGGATREHAEEGNGGLWYRTENELVAAVEALLDEDLRRTLGEQGRAYAEERFADTDSYIKRVAGCLLS